MPLRCYFCHMPFFFFLFRFSLSFSHIPFLLFLSFVCTVMPRIHVSRRCCMSCPSPLPSQSHRHINNIHKNLTVLYAVAMPCYTYFAAAKSAQHRIDIYDEHGSRSMWRGASAPRARDMLRLREVLPFSPPAVFVLRHYCPYAFLPSCFSARAALLHNTADDIAVTRMSMKC